MSLGLHRCPLQPPAPGSQEWDDAEMIAITISFVLLPIPSALGSVSVCHHIHCWLYVWLLVSQMVEGRSGFVPHVQ